MQNEDTEELHKRAQDHEKRIGTLEGEVKSLRGWRHEMANQVNIVRLMKDEMEMQDQVLERQSKMAEKTLETVSKVDMAMLGNTERPGLFEQVRGLVAKDVKRDRFTFLVLSILLTQLGAILVGLLVWGIKHQ